MLLAIGGIGGTALDQRQQYLTCQPLKKVLPDPCICGSQMNFDSCGQELDEFRSVVAAYLPTPPRTPS